MQWLLKSRPTRMLVPVALTVLVLFQAALVLHNTAHDHARDLDNQEETCFLCTAASHFVAIDGETAMPDPSRVILGVACEQPSEIIAKVVTAPLNRGPPSGLV